MNRSIATVLTTRAQYARIKSVLEELSTAESIDFNLIVSGGGLVHRFGNLTSLLDNAGIEISREIHNLVDGGTPVTQAKTTGMGIIEIATAFQDIAPDLVLITGDRYETMATTMAASYLNIPVAHLEGGELTGSIDDKVRHATTKMSDYHFVSTERSKRIVEFLGESSDRIYRPGCPSIDICSEIVEEDRKFYDPQTEYGGVGDTIDVNEEYIVIQYHPIPTEYGTNYEKTWELINAYENLDIPAFWFWPNMDAGTDAVSKAIREYRENRDPTGIRFFINLDPHDYLTVVNNSSCVVGNSSVGIRECSYFGVPVVNIGPRQQSRERAGNVIDVEIDESAITEGIRQQLDNGRYKSSSLYGSGRAAHRIVKTLSELSPTLKEPMSPEHFDLPNQSSQLSHD